MLPNRKLRKVVLDLAVTLDGFIEGENGETDWCIMDPDMKFTDFLHKIDTIFYGRKSYELWGQYTPTDSSNDEEQEMWSIIHSKKKYVFSKTLTNSDNKATFVNQNIAEQVLQLKSMPGQDIWLYGGASLITTFINLGLVDEFRISVHPVVLGEGKPLFMDLQHRLNLKLIQTNSFSSGVVQLIYHLKQDEESNI